MTWKARPDTQQEQVGRLIIAAVIVLMVPGLPVIGYALYPFTILTTWFHEMGHGMTALMFGWEFDRLVLLPDGSGVAESYPDEGSGGFSSAMVSAGGPLGPSIVGSLLILASARHELWKPTLYALAGALVLSMLIWVRSTTGFVVLPLLAFGLALIAWRAPAWLLGFSLQFLGVLAALSMFRDWDYLFSHSAVIGGTPMLSDTGAMQEALLLPYWLWAILIIVVSGAMIGGSLKYALSHEGGPSRWQ